MTDRWTTETEELVAGGIHRGSRQCVLDLVGCLAEGSHRREVREVLTALADAGLLLAPGGETREEWAAQIWADGEDPAQGQIDQRSRLETLRVVEAHGVRRALNPPETDVTARRWFGNARLLTRTVHIGPWLPVSDGGGA